MSDKTEADKIPDEQAPARPSRRPWHAPQFICTDLAATDTQGNAGNDGGPMNSPS